MLRASEADLPDDWREQIAERLPSPYTPFRRRGDRYRQACEVDLIARGVKPRWVAVAVFDPHPNRLAPGVRGGLAR